MLFAKYCCGRQWQFYSMESFWANHRKAFNGLALAILQAGRVAGELQFTARAEGLEPATISISQE